MLKRFRSPPNGQLRSATMEDVVYNAPSINTHFTLRYSFGLIFNSKAVDAASFILGECQNVHLRTASMQVWLFFFFFLFKILNPKSVLSCIFTPSHPLVTYIRGVCSVVSRGFDSSSLGGWCVSIKWRHINHKSSNSSSHGERDRFLGFHPGQKSITH